MHKSLLKCGNFTHFYKKCQYHSVNGVFGFRPVTKNEFYLDENIRKSRQINSNLYRWVEAYRQHAHRVASFDPVKFIPHERNLPELSPARYGLTQTDSVDPFGILFAKSGQMTIDEIEKQLKSLYCGNVGIEFSYIESEQEKEWLTENYEKQLLNNIDENSKKEMAALMLKCQAWDHFLAKKFPTYKRYGGEGAESVAAFFRQIFLSSADKNVETIVLGMPHRGRLNLLTTMFNTRPAKVFRKIKGLPEFPDDAKAMCDISSHFHVSEDFSINGKTVHLCMLHNPSHLEAVNPVSMGKTRSKQQSARDGSFSDDPKMEFGEKVINVQLHGDGAFIGQGINQECLMMSGTPHFEIGGTIHVIVNNQVGFTTPADRGRSSRYSSDLAKSINAPVFHVNADDPESLTNITKLAFEYQQKFRKDVFIDLNCFRRWGHNELDDPTFTNPLLYNVIHNRESIPDIYAKKLINENILSQVEIDQILNDHNNFLNDKLQNWASYKPEKTYFDKQWSEMQQATDQVTVWDTGIDYQLLNFIGRSSVHVPKDFNIHPHILKTHVLSRMQKIVDGSKIDWATAEALAFGSLMYQGHNVRISGEDVGRGTFSQRHAMFVDQKSNEIYIPLNTLKGGLGGKLELANSILSEEAVLGFEYGMAIDNPNNLIIWEAQFGDFFNGAQILIDTYFATGETKWMICNGLVMLLPHGMDGMASEHSSCRMERFLQMTDSKESQPDGDDVNFQVAYPSTPAQYFHLLRRQIVRNFRKPLLIVGPKTLLRLSDCVSSYQEFQPGTYFRTIIDDNTVAEPINVKRVILCTGKHYYNLNAERMKGNLKNVAIIRVESLCPFPVSELQTVLDKYKNAREFIWSQEEHRNMGAWAFVKPRFENMIGKKLNYRGRYEGATVAVGVSSWHVKEAEQVIKSAFE